MAPRHRLLATFGLALTGVTVAGYWFIRERAPLVETPDSDSSIGALAAHPGRHVPDYPAPAGWRNRSDVADRPARPGEKEQPVAPARLRSVGATAVEPPQPAASLSAAEVWSHYEPSREELAYRAFKVEQEANQELQALMRVLDLGEEQQDRVFAAFARGASHFHPLLQPEALAPATGAAPVGESPGDTNDVSAGGSATPESAAAQEVTDTTPTVAANPVLAELTPEQADVYERYTSERDAFWAGVIEDIEKEINDAP